MAIRGLLQISFCIQWSDRKNLMKMIFEKNGVKVAFAACQLF